MVFAIMPLIPSFRETRFSPVLGFLLSSHGAVLREFASVRYRFVPRSDQEGVCGFLAVRRSPDSTRRCLSILEVGSGCIITPIRRCYPHAVIGISSFSQLGLIELAHRFRYGECESESGSRNLNSLCEKENGSVVSAAARDPCSEMETLVRRIIRGHRFPPPSAIGPVTGLLPYIRSTSDVTFQK
jgi:hypothetical protein